MSDKHTGYIVTLESPIRGNDDPVLTALRMVRGVLSVEPVVADVHTHMAEQRAEHRVSQRVLTALYPDRFPAQGS